MSVIAIDPGNERSAFVVYEDGRVIAHGIENNTAVRRTLWTLRTQSGVISPGHLAIEMIASYGMAVGREVFDTCVWIGRYIERWGGPYTKVYRRDVKMHLCGRNTAKDSNIRSALIDRFGPGTKVAIGKKAKPGPLFGIHKDEWAALAVAVTYVDGAVKGV